MGNPVESYLNEFRQKQQADTSTTDPVADYLNEFGPDKQSNAATASVPQQPTDTRGKEALQAVGRGLKGAVTGFIPGMIESVKQIGRAALAGAQYYLDPATGIYKAIEEGTKLKQSFVDPVVSAVRFPFDAQGMTHAEALKRLEEFTGVAGTFALGEGLAAGVHKLGGGTPSSPIDRIKARQEATPASKPTAPQAVAPVGGKIDGANFANAESPEARAAIVEQMKQQAQQVAAKQADAKGRFLKAVQTWNTLSSDQRGQIVPGLAVSDYAKTWKELSTEARASVKKALNLDTPTTDANLQQSQTVPSGPAAQGEVSTGQPLSKPAGPPTNNIQGSEHLGKRFTNPARPDYQAVITKNTKPGEKPYRVSYFKTDAEGKPATYIHNAFDTPQEAYDWVTGPADKPGDKLRGYTEKTKPQGEVPYEEPISDVTYFDYQTLNDELHRAESRVGDLQSAHDNRLVKSAPESPEFKVWKQYVEDLKNEMEKRLRQPSSKSKMSPETAAKIDAQPDIGTAQPEVELYHGSPQIIEGTPKLSDSEYGPAFFLSDSPEAAGEFAKGASESFKGDKTPNITRLKIKGRVLDMTHGSGDIADIVDMRKTNQDFLDEAAKLYWRQAGHDVREYWKTEDAFHKVLMEDLGWVGTLDDMTIGEAARKAGYDVVKVHQQVNGVDHIAYAVLDAKAIQPSTLESNAPSSPAPAGPSSEGKPGETRRGAEGTLELPSSEEVGRVFDALSREEKMKIGPSWADKKWADLNDHAREGLIRRAAENKAEREGTLGNADAIKKRIREINNELGRTPAEDMRKFNDLVRERTDLEAQLGEGPGPSDQGHFQSILEKNENDRRAADRLVGDPNAKEPFDSLRLEKIQQSADDLTHVERLLNEPPISNADNIIGKIVFDSMSDVEKTSGTSISPEKIVGKTWEQIDEVTKRQMLKGVDEGLAKLRPEDLDNLIDDLDAALDSKAISDEEHGAALGEIAERKRAWKAQNVGPAPATPKAKFKLPDTMGKDLNKFSNDQLKNTLKSIGAMLQSPDLKGLPEAQMLRAEMDRIFDYQREIQRQVDEGQAGPGLSIHKIDVSGAPEYEKYFSQKIVTDAELKSPWNIVKFIRKLYQGTVRPSHALNVADRLYEGATGEKLSAHESAGKQMEMMDGTLTQAETFLRGDGPFVPDGAGNFMRAGAKSLADIVVNTAKGDVERMGWLWAARRAMDLKALRNKDIGIDLGHAQELIINSSSDLHKAVDEARQYHSALSLFAQIEELISPEARAAFEQETSYGPIQRMYGPQEIVSKIADQVNKTGRTAEQIMAGDQFKRLKGSDLLIRNMVESTIDVTHRILRAAKINRILLDLIEKAEAQPGLYKGMIDKLEHREHLQVTRDITARSAAIKALFKDAGIDLSSAHADLFANVLSDDALNMKGGIAKVWRNGKIEAWRVDELTANSLKSLTPKELPWWVRKAGIPARVGRIGIVLDPAFMVGQILNDQFQGWFNTRYGFVPVLDTFRGWWNIMHNTEAFKEAMRAGGIEKSALRGKTTLKEVIAGPALTPGELAFHQITTMQPLKALQTIITPLREATRMGEYLKARGHGASVVEAAWAARDLLGNYSLQGTFTTVRALNQMSLFLGPAIAVTDKTFRTFRERPAQWFARASTLAGIATLLYIANRDDDEIQQLRQTPGGQRWFFARVPGTGTIFKMRKPYLEGAIFASGMEAALDAYRGQNPEAFSLWAKSVEQELALNMLPVLGVVPLNVWNNKDLTSGSAIVPEGQTGLDPAYQTGYYSGSAERIAGKAAGISPAILSYVVRGTTGYLGESAVKGVSAAIDWVNTGELPPKEDLPFTQRVFAKYPSYSVKPIQDFYAMADKVGQAANTINYVVEHQPEDLEMVLAHHEKDMTKIELFNQSRQQIADLRKAITSIEDIKDLGPQSKKEYTDEFLRTIIEVASSAVTVARAMDEEQQ